MKLKMNAKLIVLLQLILIIKTAYSIKTNKVLDYKLKHQHKIKIVHYALKEQDSIKIKTVPVKNLQFEPFGNWLAKSIWIGDNYNQTGWSFLEIETNKNASDYDQAFSLGFLEGYLTRDLISLHLINTVGDFCQDDSETCLKLTNFLTTNFAWISQQVKLHQEDPYWHHVNLVFAQFYGLFHGYHNLTESYTKTNLLDKMSKDIKPYLNLIALQLNGDMGELFAALNQVSDPFIAGSCSALIKLLENDLYVSHSTWGPYELLPNNSDLLTSHVTWTVYESMLRVLKHYKINFHLNNLDPSFIPGSEIAFSSYPGILSSIDDFYILNSKLVVLETTIGNSNTDLWKYVTPTTNLYWIRNMVANRLSYTGADWAKWFSLYNSGTYNNEWMIVDYKLFYPNEALRDGLFTVLEQLPGQTVWSDKTDVLRKQTYWSSYNIAYYPSVYNLSGTYEAFLKYGSFFSYEDSPRASIFRRDHVKVKDINSMIDLMRYNNYTKDPLAQCDCNPPYSGENTIAARSDLNPATGTYPFDALGHRDHGATDMKLTSWQMARDLEFIGICGPTYDDEDITPFSWSKADFGDTTNHYGLTDTYKFSPVHVHWDL